MKFGAIYKRSVNLLINPKLEWEVIKTENKSHKQVVKDFALPVIIILSLCTIIGNAIYAKNLIYFFPYIISSGIAVFIIGYTGIIIGARIINEITPSFNSKKSLSLVFNLVIYSFSAYSIFLALALLLPSSLYQLRYFGFYSLYLFWVGSDSLCGTPTDNKVGFVFVSNLIMFGIFSILFMIFDVIIKGKFGINLFYK